MLRSIISTGLQFRYLVLVFSVVTIVLGATQLRAMPVDVLPEFSPPYVEIQTEALGLSAEEVEQLITVPLEQDLLNGVPWLHTIHSDSVPGLSSVTLVFEPGTDLYHARQMVAERLSQASVGLPNVSKSPTMLQPMSATSRFLIVGLSSKNLSLIQMSVLARWTIVPRLMGVPGVANVAVWGMRDQQLQVQVDPEKLRAHQVSLRQVLETVGNALWVSTLSFVEASTPGNAGFIDTPQQRIGLQHILPIVSPQGLSQVSIQDTQQVQLGDVADIVENHQPLIGDARTTSGTSLLLVIEKFPGSDTLKVTRGVEDALAELRPGLGGIETDPTIYRAATFIEMAMNNLTLAVVVGALLLVLALGFSFFDWRTALISLVAIPLALAAAGLVLYLRAATFNVLVLAGLAVAIGVIVDDAIVDVENVRRRLCHRPADPNGGKPSAIIILEAVLETRNPLLFATAICLLVVLPAFSLQGMPGAFFQPLAVSYMLAVLASMLVALIVTPVLCTILLSGMSVGSLNRRASPLYNRLLTRMITTPRGAYLILIVLAVAGLAVLPFLSPSPLPTFKEPDLLIRLDAASGTSHPEMARLIDNVSRELEVIPGVRNVGAHVGRAVFGDQIVGINSAELWISIAPNANYEETLAAVNSAIDGYPGLQRNVRTYLEQTSRPVLAAPSDPIFVRIFGQDWAILKNQAEQVRQALSGISGIVDSHTRGSPEEPTLEVEVDLAAAQRYSIKPGDVRRTAATLLNGLQVGNLFEEQKVFDVVVWSTPATRASLTNVREMLIDTPSGVPVRLGDIAQVRFKPLPSAIPHEDVSRYIDIGISVNGRDFGSVMGDIRARLRQMQFPLEYHAEAFGAYEDKQAAQNRLLAVATIALIGILLFLQAAFQSWRLAFLSFLILPAALAGGLVAALAVGGVLSLGVLAGLVTVFGIAARNQIVLIDRLSHLEHDAGEPFGPELVLHGAGERLSPILMTALTTGLVLVPILLLGDVPGLEVLRPMAAVILGGLVTSTLLNLLIAPPLYLRFGKAAVRSDPDLQTLQLGDGPVAT